VGLDGDESGRRAAVEFFSVSRVGLASLRDQLAHGSSIISSWFMNAGHAAAAAAAAQVPGCRARCLSEVADSQALFPLRCLLLRSSETADPTARLRGYAAAAHPWNGSFCDWQSVSQSVVQHRRPRAADIASRQWARPVSLCSTTRTSPRDFLLTISPPVCNQCVCMR